MSKQIEDPQLRTEFLADGRSKLGAFEASQIDSVLTSIKDATKLQGQKELAGEKQKLDIEAEAKKQEAITKKEVIVEGAKEGARKLAALENQQFQKNMADAKDKNDQAKVLRKRTTEIENRYQKSNNAILGFTELISRKEPKDFTGPDDFSLMFKFISALDDHLGVVIGVLVFGRFGWNPPEQPPHEIGLFGFRCA